MDSRKPSLDAFLSGVEQRLKSIDAPCEHRAAKRCTGCLAERALSFVEGQDVAGLVAVVRAAIEAAHRRGEGVDPFIDAGYNRAHGEILRAMESQIGSHG